MRPMLPCQDRDANRIVQCNMFPWKLGVKDKEETDQCQGWGSEPTEHSWNDEVNT